MRVTTGKFLQGLCHTILVAILLLFGTKGAWARTDLFFIGPATVVGEAGEEVTLTIYVKAERLRAFGFTLLLDTRYVTYVDNSISKTEMTKDFDFLGANLLEDEVYDENRPYLKQLIFGGSVLEPVSSVWEDGGTKHGISALATFKLRLVEGFTPPQDGYLLLPVATDKTVNDFKGFEQGGGILFFTQRGVEPPSVSIISPKNEERIDDLNATLTGTATPGEGQVLSVTFWLDPFKIQEPVPGSFVLGTGNTITLDFTQRAPTIQTVIFGAMDQNKNGAATFSVFGVQEDVVVIFQGMISGIVRNATLLTPISGAEVILYEKKEDGLSRVQSVTSGLDGRFSLENVGKGTYTIIAHKEGFQEGSKEVSLPTDNSTIEGVIIELFSLGRPTGEVYTYITGRFCASFEGEQSQGAAEGFEVEDISGLYSCTFEEDGCCVIEGLRKGEDFKYMWHVVGQDGYSLATPPQPVPEDGTIKLTVFRPTDTTLEAWVLDPVTMEGVEGAWVRLKDPSTGETVAEEGPTGKTGMVTFYDLDPGEQLTITATLEADNHTQEVAWDLDLREGKNVVSLYLHGYDPGQLTRGGSSGARLIIQLMDGDTLRPLDVSPQYITLTDEGATEVHISAVGDHYEATGLNAGNYTLDVTPPGYQGLEAYKVIIKDNNSTGLVVYLSMESAPQVDGYTFGPLGQGTLKGVVLGMGDLEPVWNAQVTISDGSGNQYYKARTNAIGQFEKRGLSPGKYWVGVEASGFQTARYLIDLMPGESRQVTLKVFPVTQMQSTLEPGSGPVGVLHGVVLSSVLDFSPHPLVRAHVRGVSRIDGGVLFEKDTDSSGNFVVKTSFGGEPFDLEVSATGYKSRQIGPIQLHGEKVHYLSIFLMPEGTQLSFTTQGLSGSLAQYLPEPGNLLLFGERGLKVAALDDIYRSLRPLDQWEEAGPSTGALVLFGPSSTEQDGSYLVADYMGDSLHLIDLGTMAGSFTGLSWETTLPGEISSIAYKYPVLFVGTESGISSMDIKGAISDPETGLSHVRTNWHMGEITAPFLFTNGHGLMSVDSTGKVYFIETVDPLVPVLRDTWNLYLSPLHGEIRGGFGIFCDTNGRLVPIKADVTKGQFLRGRDYWFNRFKRALVFEIDHPLKGYEGKTMALALLMEDKYVDLLELTDLNLWLLRRYPIEGVKDIFLGRVWQEYSMGQDRYEGAFYVVMEDGLKAIPLPHYLDGEASITLHGIDQAGQDGYIFTDKGYLLNLSIPGQGNEVLFHPVPGTYDLYYLKAKGSEPTRVDALSAFGNKTVSFAPDMDVDLETISYPGGATRVFHEGDRFGVEMNVVPKAPEVVDVYLLTEVPSLNSTVRFYWKIDESGMPRAYVFGENATEPYPHPIAQGLYLNHAISARTELFGVPGVLKGLQGDMELYVVPAGVPLDEAMGNGILGQDRVGFRIE